MPRDPKGERRLADVMMSYRKYEVHGVDPSGGIWMVGTDSLETAQEIKKQFEDEGHSDVRIVEN
jgi:hypothetical protein